ncbi:geraniol 8-hydroxylase-like isoform X2 [Cryptomeria japonica]|uniref:geraniol 8-hydroxylase-like isoform X2 n=1 Tax=Cryptomeria japonica TaxID=3369 RepID=UPI0027DA2E59|nr:geraniol 8-hydroxylase-like isoform X2 [Cryptomeria japonica]
MDSLPVYWFSVLISGVLVLFSVLLWRKKTNMLPLPPGPPAWPVVGNLFLLGQKPNYSLFALSRQYGPLMTIYLGMKRAVVVSTSAMAKEVLKTHDHNFAGRTLIQAMKVLSYHKSSLVWSQYGPYWRKLRRVLTTELLSPKKLQASQHVRRDSVFEMVRLIFEDNCAKGKSVSIGDTMIRTALNLMGNMIFSANVFDPSIPNGVELSNGLSSWVKLCQKPHLADLFPCLGFLDLHGVGGKIGVQLKRAHYCIDLSISNRLESRRTELGNEGEAPKDFLDSLLELRDQGDQDISLTQIRAIIFLVAGSDNTGATLEWAMAELIHNPHTMKKVQEELEQVVGRERRVEESDLDHLPYLRAVVKEVFRLHPVAPLLLPHRADSSCEIMGFVIPKDTQIWVNVWAIGRDPAVWKEPSKFMPERFLEGEKSKMDFKGQDFDLIPLGAGRRMCVGLPLADKMVHLILASLIHSFDWSLPDGIRVEEMDMDDVFSIVLKKRQGLQAIPTPRLPHSLY